MGPIEFQRVVVGRPAPGELLLALFDGAHRKGTPTECVALLTCSDDAARALVKVLSSALAGSKR